MLSLPAELGLSTLDVARQLDLSPERVRQLARAGRIPFTPTAIGRLYDPEAVRALAEARRQLVGPADAGGGGA
jgi:hypothetical protein